MVGEPSLEERLAARRQRRVASSSVPEMPEDGALEERLRARKARRNVFEARYQQNLKPSPQEEQFNPWSPGQVMEGAGRQMADRLGPVTGAASEMIAGAARELPKAAAGTVAGVAAGIPENAAHIAQLLGLDKTFPNLVPALEGAGRTITAEEPLGYLEGGERRDVGSYLGGVGVGRTVAGLGAAPVTRPLSLAKAAAQEPQALERAVRERFSTGAWPEGYYPGKAVGHEVGALASAIVPGLAEFPSFLEQYFAEPDPSVRSHIVENFVRERGPSVVAGVPAGIAMAKAPASMIARPLEARLQARRAAREQPAPTAEAPAPQPQPGPGPVSPEVLLELQKAVEEMPPPRPEGPPAPGPEGPPAEATQPPALPPAPPTPTPKPKRPRKPSQKAAPPIILEPEVRPTNLPPDVRDAVQTGPKPVEMAGVEVRQTDRRGEDRRVEERAVTEEHRTAGRRLSPELRSIIPLEDQFAVGQPVDFQVAGRGYVRGVVKGFEISGNETVPVVEFEGKRYPAGVEEGIRHVEGNDPLPTKFAPKPGRLLPHELSRSQPQIIRMSESFDEMLARTEAQPDRHADMDARAAEARNLVRGLQVGDVIVQADGSRTEITSIGYKGASRDNRRGTGEPLSITNVQDGIEIVSSGSEIVSILFAGTTSYNWPRTSSGYTNPAHIERPVKAGAGKIASERQDTVRTPVERPEAGPSDTTVRTESQSAPARWEVVEAANLKTSFDADYPKVLQPRDTNRMVSRTRISSIAQSLNPELLAESALAADGAPVVGPGYEAYTGNHRLESIREAYAQQGESATRYRHMVVDRAKKYGLQVPEGMKSPVLVRRMTEEMTPEARQKFVEDANAPSAATMGAAEKARQDAGRLDADTMAALSVPEDGNLRARENAPFLRMFAARVIPKSELGAFVGPKGELNTDGLRRVQNAIFEKAYGSAELLGRAAESLDDNVRNLTKSLLQAAPRFATIADAVKTGDLHDVNLAQQISLATEQVARLRERGDSVKVYLQQFTIESRDPVVDTLVQILGDTEFKIAGTSPARSVRLLTEVLRNYADLVEAAGSPKQMSIFETTGPPTREDLLVAAINRTKQANGEAPSLFTEETDAKRPTVPEKHEGEAKAPPSAARKEPAAEVPAEGAAEKAAPVGPTAEQKADRVGPSEAQFEERLSVEGEGLAPNGHAYKIQKLKNDRFTVTRTSPEGTADTIVGIRGETFGKFSDAEAWARWDGRQEKAAASPSKSLPWDKEPRQIKTLKSSGFLDNVEKMIAAPPAGERAWSPELQEYARRYAKALEESASGDQYATDRFEKWTSEASFKNFDRKLLPIVEKRVEHIYGQSTKPTQAMRPKSPEVQEATSRLPPGWSIHEAKDGYTLAKGSERVAVPNVDAGVRHAWESEGQMSLFDSSVERPTTIREASSRMEKEDSAQMRLQDGNEVQAFSPRRPNYVRPKKGGKVDQQVRSVNDMIDALGKATDIAFRKGRFNTKKAIGVFKVHSEVIRWKDKPGTQLQGVPAGVETKLATIAHEIGHLVWKRSADARRAATLGPELLHVSAKYYAGKPSIAEGFAEAHRLYVTDPAVAKADAPKTTAFLDQWFAENMGPLRDKINEVREDIPIYRKATPENQVASEISHADRTKGWANLDDYYTAIWDRTHPVKELVTDIQRTTGKTLSRGEDPYVWIRQLAAWSDKAEVMWKTRRFNFGSLEDAGPPLKDSFQKIWKDRRMFEAYLIARRAPAYGEKNLPLPHPMKTYSEALKRLDEKYPNFREVAKEVDDFKLHMMRYLRDAGGITDAKIEALAKIDPFHIPFWRAVEKDGGGLFLSPKGRTVNLGSVIKRKKGGTEPIISPLESLVKWTNLMVSWSERNAAANKLLDLVEETPGQGRWSESVMPLQRPDKIDVRRVLEEAGIPENDPIMADLDAAGLKDFVTIFRPALWEKDPNVIVTWKKGEPRLHHLDPGLKEALMMPSDSLPSTFKLLRYPAQMLGVGVTATYGFAFIRNPVKDQATAWMYSNYGYKPFYDLARGVYHVAKKTDTYTDAKIAGAFNSEFNAYARKYLRKDLEFEMKSKWKKLGHYVISPVQALVLLSTGSERATRAMMTGRAFQKEGRTREGFTAAGFEGREGTVDFSRRGAKVAALSSIARFWNAQMQGLDRMVREAKDNPVRFSLRAAIGITAPSLALWWAQKDDPKYKHLDQWKKDIAWPVIIGENVYWIPKPFELGIIYGSFPERIARKLIDDDPEAFDDFGETMARQIPVPWPTALVPIIENLTNHSMFFDRPVVPQSEQRLEPSEQYGPYTSPTAKGIGRVLNVSPRKVENLARGYGGAWATGIMNAPRALMPDKDKPAGRTLPEILLPGVGGTYPRYASEQVNKFYQNYEETDRAYATLKKMMERGETERAEAYRQKKGDLAALASSYRSAAEVMSRFSSAIRRIGESDLTADEKRKQIDEMSVKRNEFAAKVNEAAREAEGARKQ